MPTTLFGRCPLLPFSQRRRSCDLSSHDGVMRSVHVLTLFVRSTNQSLRQASNQASKEARDTMDKCTMHGAQLFHKTGTTDRDVWIDPVTPLHSRLDQNSCSALGTRLIFEDGDTGATGRFGRRRQPRCPHIRRCWQTAKTRAMPAGAHRESS